MKIGVLTDIHNNVVALDAMLNLFAKESCEQIICAGDILSIGPFPSQTVNRIISINNLIAVKGNHDRYLTEGLLDREQMGIDEINHHKWERSILSESEIKYISSLPNRIDTIIENVRLTVLHYAMNENGEYLPVIRNMSENDCAQMFGDIDSDVIVFGHSHQATVLYKDEKLYINCGALGCPSRSLNIARGGVLTLQNGNASIKSVQVEYNVKYVLDEINRLKYPCADYIKKGFFGVK